MSFPMLSPWAAGLVFVIVALMIAVRDHETRAPLWQIPALFSVLFLIFSLVAVIHEGPTGFWAEHSRNLWGNQIWFDLLLAIGVSWTLIVPEARSLGMRPFPWLLVIVATGCIGLTAMLARLLYLRAKVGAN